MKKYVFLTFAIPGIGGTQIYVRNKILFLRQQGWNPIVITEESEGEICVRELLAFKDNIVPEILRSPMLLRKHEREQVLDRMAAIVGEVNGDAVIESNFIMATLWGELLAQKLGIKHFIFLIQEDYSLNDKRFMKFFDFKFQRGELAGNTPVAISKLFSGYRTLPEECDTYLSAYCSNTVEDCESIHIERIKQADYNIGSIGRLNKPFVIPMIKDLLSFAQMHKDKTFQIVLFGGTPDSKELDTIIGMVRLIENADIYVTGAIFPVPRKALDKMDVFVSSAGAAATSANLGYTTIVIDANDFEPIGVLGYTTNELVHRIPGIPHESTQELLEQVLIEKKYPAKVDMVVNDETEYEAAFKKHMQYLSGSTDKKTYYPIKKVGPSFMRRVLYYAQNA